METSRSRANSLASFSATSSPSKRSRSGRAGLKSHVRFCEECLSQSCGCCPWVSRPATDQSSTQTTGQESGTNSLCREPRRRRIDQRANAPIWMPTVLDSGFDPAYWQLEATLSKITGTSKRQHPCARIVRCLCQSGCGGLTANVALGPDPVHQPYRDTPGAKEPSFA